jgi:predicted signal transduction protein with EAL and GGDEF domain
VDNPLNPMLKLAYLAGTAATTPSSQRMTAPVAWASIPTALAARIVGSLDRPFVIDGREVYIGACVGIALAPADGDSTELLLKNADAR